VGASIALAIVSFTPLAYIWFHSVSGLSLELTRLALLPTRILVLIPGLTVMLSFMRSILVNNQKTKPITIATVTEVTGILGVLFLTIHVYDLVGVIAASMALVIGRFLADVYLIYPCSKAL
jgi:O-antigen/teichoic acid export membrane protein